MPGSSSILLAISILVLCTSALPDGWASAGCWSDNTNARALSAASYFDPVFSTQEACITFCDERHYTIAGAEFGRECYCDMQLHNNASQQAIGDCNVTCPFNNTQDCGGSNRLSLFKKEHGPTLVLSFSGSLPGTWDYLGSFDNTKPNSEPFAVEAIIAGTTDTSGSVENCLTWCTENFGCSLCSVSDGGVCECGNNLQPGRIESSNTGSLVCSKNSSEICGDSGLWQVYQFTENGN